MEKFFCAPETLHWEFTTRNQHIGLKAKREGCCAPGGGGTHGPGQGGCGLCCRSTCPNTWTVFLLNSSSQKVFNISWPLLQLLNRTCSLKGKDRSSLKWHTACSIMLNCHPPSGLKQFPWPATSTIGPLPVQWKPSLLKRCGQERYHRLTICMSLAVIPMLSTWVNLSESLI